uniref:Uncharacterized protein n=1 Tax=Arundo donax TaxID=35708 RepID=A0A0A9DGH5_ARUDO
MTRAHATTSLTFYQEIREWPGTHLDCIPVTGCYSPNNENVRPCEAFGSLTARRIGDLNKSWPLLQPHA